MPWLTKAASSFHSKPVLRDELETRGLPSVPTMCDLLGLLGVVWGMAGTDNAEEVAEARRGQGLLNASVLPR